MLGIIILSVINISIKAKLRYVLLWVTYVKSEPIWGCNVLTFVLQHDGANNSQFTHWNNSFKPVLSCKS
jgi:hypothetical protein